MQRWSENTSSELLQQPKILMLLPEAARGKGQQVLISNHKNIVSLPASTNKIAGAESHEIKGQREFSMFTQQNTSSVSYSNLKEGHLEIFPPAFSSSLLFRNVEPFCFHLLSIRMVFCPPLG